MNNMTIQELNILESEKENFRDGIWQALEALTALKRLAGKSTIARDFEITASVLKDALLKTIRYIDELKEVIEEEAVFEVSCAVCGTIAETETIEEALNHRNEHEKNNNNLHQCVIIEK